MKMIFRILFLVLVVFTSVNRSEALGQFFFFDNPLVGKPAPDFTLNTTGEKNLSLTAFREGKPAIVFFWATWCPHCREQLTVLKDQKQELIEKGIKVVFIDMGEGAPQVRAFMQKYGIDADVFLDADSTVGEAYGVIGIPTFVFIDAQGVVKAVENIIPSDYEKMLLARDDKQ